MLTDEYFNTNPSQNPVSFALHTEFAQTNMAKISTVVVAILNGSNGQIKGASCKIEDRPDILIPLHN